MTLYIVAKKYRDLIYKKIDKISVEESIYGIATTEEGLDKLIENCVKDHWGNYRSMVYDEDIRKLKANNWNEYCWFEVQI